METSPLLMAEIVAAWYGKRQVLSGVKLSIAANQIVALVGHNGAGKSTLLKLIFGLLPRWSGSVYLSGELIRRPSPRAMLDAGVAYMPQGNRIFPNLTVSENLSFASLALKQRTTPSDGVARAISMFPMLEGKLRQRAATLSGGEKQILALASVMIRSPRVLLLDEPSLGLSPSLAADTFQQISQLNSVHGTTFLIVEQRVRLALKVSHYVYVLRNGQVSFSGPTSALQSDEQLRQAFL